VGRLGSWGIWSGDLGFRGGEVGGLIVNRVVGGRGRGVYIGNEKGGRWVSVHIWWDDRIQCYASRSVSVR